MKTEGQRIVAARNAWQETDEGQRVSIGQASGVYLRNRIDVAFRAGWDAAKRDVVQQVAHHLGVDDA